MRAKLGSAALQPDQYAEIATVLRVDRAMARASGRSALGATWTTTALDRDRAGEGTVFTVTICGERGAADRSAEIAAEFIRDELGDLEAASGVVSVNRAMSEVLDAAHA
jgi:hypothetical protein